MKKMSKPELLSIGMGAGATVLAVETLEKIIVTTLAMLVGTTLSFFWRRYLEKNKKK